MRDIDVPEELDLSPTLLFDLLIERFGSNIVSAAQLGIAWSIHIVFRDMAFALEASDGTIRLRTSSGAEDIDERQPRVFTACSLN